MVVSPGTRSVREDGSYAGIQSRGRINSFFFLTFIRVCTVLCLIAQLCPALCDPVDCSPPGSSVHVDSPGKNTGIGCHALLQGIFQPRDGTQVFHISCIAGGFFMIRQQGSPQTSNVSVLCLATQLCLTLCNPMNSSPPGSFVCGDSPGNNTGVGCHGLLQRIFPTQGSNPGLSHCRQILYQLSHEASPRILE